MRLLSLHCAELMITNDDIFLDPETGQLVVVIACIRFIRISPPAYLYCMCLLFVEL